MHHGVLGTKIVSLSLVFISAQGHRRGRHTQGLVCQQDE